MRTTSLKLQVTAYLQQAVITNLLDLLAKRVEPSVTCLLANLFRTSRPIQSFKIYSEKLQNLFRTIKIYSSIQTASN